MVRGWDDLVSGLDKAGEFVEDAVESGVESAGQAIDAGLDSLSGIARGLGAGSAADLLTDLSDQVASLTGGAVDELQLGQTDDPRELVRGDVGAINEAVTTLTELGTNIGSTGSALRTVDAAGWSGDAADNFNEVFDKQPGVWQDAADAMTAASQALTSWSGTIEAAQARAADAIEKWEQAENEERAKKSSYNALTDEQRGATELVDTWTALYQDAIEILRSARTARNNAASQIAGQLNTQTDAAPEEPPFTQRMVSNLVDASSVFDHGKNSFTSGLITGLTGIVQFARQVNPTDSYNASHPAEYFSNMSDLGTGLVVAVADPGATVDAFVDDALENPFEFAGSLTGDALLTAGTGGAGAGVAGARTTMHMVDTAGDLSSGLRVADDVADAGRHAPSPESPPLDTPSTDPAGVDAPRTESHPVNGENPSPQLHAESDSGAARAADDAGVSCDQTSKEVLCVQDPVDAATGEFLLPETDLSLPGVLPLVLGRRHRSNYRYGRWFGPSWSTTLDMRVVVEEAGVTLLAEDGVMVTYPHPTVGAPVRPDRSRQRWILARTESGGYFVRDQDRSITWHFAPKPTLAGVDTATGNYAISAITDRHRNRILFHYGPDGAPVEISHSGGYRVMVDARMGRISSLAVAEPDSDYPLIIRRFGYESGHLTAVTNSHGGTTSYTYDREGRMISWRDSNGNQMVNTFDSVGRVVEQDGTDGIMSARYEYVSTGDGTGSVTMVTDSMGARTAHGFDSDLRPRDVVTPNGSHTHTDYNERRDPLRVTGPDGATTRYLYTPSGDIAQITRPDGNAIRIDYAGAHQPTAVHHVDGTVERQEWDKTGNLTTATDAVGNRTQFQYHPSGAVSSVTRSTGARTFVECNAAGLPIAVTDPTGAVTRIARDAFGRTSSVTDPTGSVTHFRWSPEGKLLERANPDGSRESWEYDDEGNLLSHTNPNSGTTAYTYGAFDLLADRTDPDGSTTRYRWDTERRLTSVTNTLNQTWNYEYDADGLLIAETDFDGARTTYTHDRAGRLSTTTSTLGVTRHHEYDLLGRLAGVRADSGESREYRHDSMGRTLSAVSGFGDDPTHTVEFEYSSVGKPVRQTVDQTQELRFEYDTFGRRIARRSHTGGSAEWRWNMLGRIASVYSDGHAVDIEYDPRGSVSRWKTGELAVGRSYDEIGRLAAQEVVAHPASSLSFDFDSGPTADPRVLRLDSFEYRRDGYLTRQTTTTDEVLRRHFDLDAAGRITSVVDNGTTVEQFEYDGLSNIVDQNTASIPEGETTRNEYHGTLLVRDGRTRYRYDDAGRLIRKTVTRLSRKPDIWHFRHDGFDQLVGVTTPDGTEWQYTYDAFGRRTTKTRLGNDGSPEHRTRFTWDETVLVEQTGTDATTRWTHHPESHTPLTQNHLPFDMSDQGSVDAEFYAIVTDLVGSPTELVDPQSADVVGRAKTSLWGQTTWSGIAATSIRFPGQYFDEETGLHYNLHRYYNPGTARFITPDPLGLAPSPNPNTYPHNPTAWTDPLGLTPAACVYSNSSADAARFHESLTDRQYSSMFNEAGELRPETIAQSKPIIYGEDIGNPRFIELVADRGQSPEDWAKYKTPSYPTEFGRAETHFYRNRTTDEIMYELDYKTKLVYK